MAARRSGASSSSSGCAAAALLLAVLSLSLLGMASALEQLVYTEDFLNARVKENILKMPVYSRMAMNGTLKRAPAQPKKLVSVSCLNSVAPEPLGWRMWCPDTHATVTQWVDAAGATHRKIQLRPQQNMTAKQAVWFMTPGFPKTLTIGGKSFTKHQLWHPLDHKLVQQFKLGPSAELMSKLDEVYRSPAEGLGSDRRYRTEMWVAATDLASNLPRNRYVLGLDVLGFQAFTLIVEFEDAPNDRGMVASVEVILGAAAKGFDPKNPSKGAPHKLAAAANTLLLEPMMAPYRANGDFDAALDAVTRHVVEEFGNLQFFVPAAWAASPQGRVAAELNDLRASAGALKDRLTGKNASVEGMQSLKSLTAHGAKAALAGLSGLSGMAGLDAIDAPAIGNVLGLIAERIPGLTAEGGAAAGAAMPLLAAAATTGSALRVAAPGTIERADDVAADNAAAAAADDVASRLRLGLGLGLDKKLNGSSTVGAMVQAVQALDDRAAAGLRDGAAKVAGGVAARAGKTVDGAYGVLTKKLEEIALKRAANDTAAATMTTTTAGVTAKPAAVAAPEKVVIGGSGGGSLGKVPTAPAAAVLEQLGAGASGASGAAAAAAQGKPKRA